MKEKWTRETEREKNPDMERPTFVRFSVILTVALALWQLMWALVSPAFRTPDEPVHLNSVLRMATTGAWQDPGQAHIDMSVVRATVEAGLIEKVGNDYSLINRTDLLGSPHAQGTSSDYYTNLNLPEHLQRSVIVYTDDDSPIVDQMTQHPPLYYKIAAKTLKLTGATHWTWDRQVLFLRIFSIFLTLPVLPCIVYTARKMGLSRRGALAAGSTIFAVPQYSFIVASVSNDSLTFTAGALTIAALARAVTGKGTRLDVVLLGLALGLGLWTKGTFIPMGAVVGLAFLGNRNISTWKERLNRGLASGIIGLLTGGFWWARNLLLFGDVQPEGMIRPHLSEGKDNLHFLSVALKNLIESSWAKLGWLEWTGNSWLIAGCAFALLLMVVVAIARGPERYGKFMLVLYYLLAGAMILFGAWNGYRADGVIAGVQGRYMFPALAGLLVVAACAWAPALDKAPKWMYAIPGTISVGIGLVTMLGWWQVCYATFDRWTYTAGFNSSRLICAIVMCLAALLVAVIIPTLGKNELSRDTEESYAQRAL